MLCGSGSISEKLFKMTETLSNQQKVGMHLNQNLFCNTENHANRNMEMLVDIIRKHCSFCWLVKHMGKMMLKGRMVP